MQNHRKDAAKQRRRGGLCLRTMTTFLAALSDGWLAGLFAAWSWSLHKRPTRAERPALHSCTLAAPRRAARLIRRFKLASRSVCQHWMDREPGASTVRVRRVEAINGGRYGWPKMALPSLFEMKNRSLPGDRQGGDLVPVCPLLDSAQHCPCALRCWSVYRSLFATRTNRRATGTGEESNRLHLSGSAWFDVDRFSNGQRRSCGLAKRPGRHNCSVFWLCTFSEEQATTNVMQWAQAGMQDWPGPKVDGEMENLTTRS
jgi:hypothetical protein